MTLYSRSCEYALRALVYLATLEDGCRATVDEISERERLPTRFLAKLLHTLARAGILRSVKGPGGGFALAFRPIQITLLDVVACIDGDVSLEQCITGVRQCDGASPCGLRDQCESLRASISSYLMRTNLLTMRRALEEKLVLPGQQGEPVSV